MLKAKIVDCSIIFNINRLQTNLNDKIGAGACQWANSIPFTIRYLSEHQLIGYKFFHRSHLTKKKVDNILFTEFSFTYTFKKEFRRRLQSFFRENNHS